MDRRNNHSNFHTEITLFKTARFAGFSATQFRGVYSYTLPAGALPRLVSNVQSVSGGSDESASWSSLSPSVSDRRTAGACCSFFDHPPPSLPLAPRYRVPRDHGLPALRDVHLLVNVLHSDVLVSPGSLAL